MKKKWLTFSAGIVGLISCSILAVLNIITVIALDNLANITDYLYAVVDWEIAACILAIITIIPIALNSCAINVLTTEKYYKSKAKIITAIVFNFIVLLYNLIVIVGVSLADWMIALGVILIIALLACNVLYIVDLSLKIKDVEDSPAKTVKVSQNTNEANLNEKQLLDELEKLMNLRERKVLTQEEFEKLKNQIMDKYI